jgi:hypothetical protein
MSILETLELKIKTGRRGLDRAPGYAINSHEIPLDQMSGGYGSGETLVASGSPSSFPHSLTLTGPDEGFWDIEGIELTLHIGAQPYTVHLGAVILDSESKLNLWYDRPPLLLDV